MTLLLFRLLMLILAVAAMRACALSEEPILHFANLLRLTVFTVTFYALMHSLIFH